MAYYGVFTALCLLVSVIESNDVVQKCSGSDEIAGIAAISRFTLCSGMTKTQILGMAGKLKQDKSLVKSLRNKAKTCHGVTSREKDLCLASFMAEIAANQLLTLGDGAETDLASTCECLAAAVDTVPNCGSFAGFSDFAEVMPESMCQDIGQVCRSIKDLDGLCLLPSTPYSRATCAAVQLTAASCGDYAEIYWQAGQAGSTYCSLNAKQVRCNSCWVKSRQT
jgi:hypothetical protein